MIKIFSSAMIAACGMGIHLREDRPRGGAGEDHNDGQCDWKQEVGLLIDALDIHNTGKVGFLAVYDHEGLWEAYYDNETKEAKTIIEGFENAFFDTFIDFELGLTAKDLLDYWKG